MGGMIDLNDCAQIDACVDCRLESFGPAQDKLREGSGFKLSHYRNSCLYRTRQPAAHLADDGREPGLVCAD